MVLENIGFGLNPGVELAPPRSLLSNWRDRPARKNPRNVMWWIRATVAADATVKIMAVGIW